jgi:hypothetical protein
VVRAEGSAFEQCAIEIAAHMREIEPKDHALGIGIVK